MSGINKEQAAAASHAAGHAIVLAGPGTGKTSTLIARHSFLRSKGIDGGKIVVVTFTQKAAEELKNRLGTNVPPSAWIGTFHGICLRFLKRFHIEANLRKAFKVLDPSGQRDILNKAGVVWDADDGDLTDIIGRWKDSMTSPDEAAAEAARKGNSVLRMATEHYQTYQEELTRRGDLDFADLVVKALALLRDSPEVKQFVSERLTHVLVDEFQDVNKSQIEFLQAMVAAGSAVWAVADDDQALYGWRGGNVRYTVNFSEYFTNATTYALSVNYRCDPAILAGANTVISNNKMRVRKALKPSRDHKKGTCIRIRGFRNEREEAEWIATSLERFMSAGANLKDISILFRTSSVSPSIQNALETKKIPFSLSGAQSFWDLPEVTAVADVLIAIEKNDPARITRFKGARDIVETMKGASPKEAAGAVGRMVGDQPPLGSNGERAALWADAAEAAANFAGHFATAGEFQTHISEMSGKVVSGDGEGVSISTIHSSKGLEWRHVIIAGAEASIMPHHRSDDVEEERRLFYVALTRSKGSVDISYSRQRFGKSQTPSPFLAELMKAQPGAVVWSGDDAEKAAKLEAAPAAANPAAPNAAQTNDGKPVVYKRKGGRRSLIPPDER